MLHIQQICMASEISALAWTVVVALGLIGSFISDLQTSSLYLSNDRGWSQISTIVTRPGYIISQGYPYHYTPGAMWLWEIDFDNAYVGLLLSNVSFTVYKVRLFVML